MDKIFLGYIGERARREFTDKVKCEIIALHSESIYMKMPCGRLALICPSKYGTVPFAFALDDFETVRNICEHKIGDVVEVSVGNILFSDGTSIYIKEKKTPKKSSQKEIVLSRQRIKTAIDVASPIASRRGIFPALEVLVCCGKPSENANAYALRVAGCADIIEESLMHKDADYLSSAIDSIIGLGLGLTPSGDDFITGMLYSFSFFARKSRRAAQYFTMLSKAVKVKTCRTSEISREYLLCACEGLYYEIVTEVLESLTEDDRDIEGSVLRLLSVGASSGADILCGILFSMYILM